MNADAVYFAVTILNSLRNQQVALDHDQAGKENQGGSDDDTSLAPAA